VPLAAASHPAIVAIYDVEPGDLARDGSRSTSWSCARAARLPTGWLGGALPPDDAVHIVAAVAEGLAALHDGGSSTAT
jgi:hypothetical protein